MIGSLYGKIEERDLRLPAVVVAMVLLVHVIMLDFNQEMPVFQLATPGIAAACLGGCLCRLNN